jgi:hypothetical protein
MVLSAEHASTSSLRLRHPRILPAHAGRARACCSPPKSAVCPRSQKRRGYRQDHLRYLTEKTGAHRQAE